MSEEVDGTSVPPDGGQQPPPEGQAVAVAAEGGDAPTGELGIAVSLDQFSGPMDLLLYLVRRAEVDARDLPITDIADQFAAWVAAAVDLDLEAAGDFVVMAATLLEIKARLVVPPPEGTEVPDDGEDAYDPRAGLIRKLLAYRAAKEAAFDLDRRDDERRFRHERGHREVVPDDPAEVDAWELKDVDIGALSGLWFDLLKRIDSLGPRTVIVDDVPMGVRIAQVVEAMRLHGEGRMSELFALEPHRLGRVGLVMAVLESTRQRFLQIRQGEQYGDVLMRFRPEDERAVVSGDPGPPELLPKRQRRPPLVTWSRPGGGDAELDQSDGEEEPPENEEQRFLRDLEQSIGIERLLSRSGDLELGFISWWEETHPGEPLPPGVVKPAPPPPPPPPPPEPPKPESTAVVPAAETPRPKRIPPRPKAARAEGQPPAEAAAPAVPETPAIPDPSPIMPLAIADPSPAMPSAIADPVPGVPIPEPVAVVEPAPAVAASEAAEAVPPVAEVQPAPEPALSEPAAEAEPVAVVEPVAEAAPSEPLAAAGPAPEMASPEPEESLPVAAADFAPLPDVRDPVPTFAVEPLPSFEPPADPIAEVLPPIEPMPAAEPEPTAASPMPVEPQEAVTALDTHQVEEPQPEAAAPPPAMVEVPSVAEAAVEPAPVASDPIAEAAVVEFAPIAPAPVAEPIAEAVAVEPVPVASAPIAEAAVIEFAPVASVPVPEPVVEAAAVESAPIEPAPVAEPIAEVAAVEPAPVALSPPVAAPIVPIASPIPEVLPPPRPASRPPDPGPPHPRPQTAPATRQPLATTTPNTTSPMSRPRNLRILALAALIVLANVAFLVWLQRPGEVLAIAGGPDGGAIVARDGELAWTLNLPLEDQAAAPLPTISPEVPGAFSWRDARTVVFKPTTAMPAAATFAVAFPPGLRAAGSFRFPAKAVPSLTVRTLPAVAIGAVTTSVPAFGDSTVALALNRVPADPAALIAGVTVVPALPFHAAISSGSLVLSGAFVPGTAYHVSVAAASGSADDRPLAWTGEIAIPERSPGARLVAGIAHRAPMIEAVGLGALEIEAVRGVEKLHATVIPTFAADGVLRAAVPAWLLVPGANHLVLRWEGGSAEVDCVRRDLALDPADAAPLLYGGAIPVVSVR